MGGSRFIGKKIRSCGRKDGNVRNHRFGAPMLSGSFGGQQQRALLARVALCDEKPTLLDEPVTGLDPIVTGRIL